MDLKDVETANQIVAEIAALDATEKEMRQSPLPVLRLFRLTDGAAADILKIAQVDISSQRAQLRAQLAAL